MIPHYEPTDLTPNFQQQLSDPLPQIKEPPAKQPTTQPGTAGPADAFPRCYLKVPLEEWLEESGLSVQAWAELERELEKYSGLTHATMKYSLGCSEADVSTIGFQRVIPIITAALNIIFKQDICCTSELTNGGKRLDVVWKIWPSADANDKTKTIAFLEWKRRNFIRVIDWDNAGVLNYGNDLDRQLKERRKRQEEHEKKIEENRQKRNRHQDGEHQEINLTRRREEFDPEVGSLFVGDAWQGMSQVIDYAKKQGNNRAVLSDYECWILITFDGEANRTSAPKAKLFKYNEKGLMKALLSHLIAACDEQKLNRERTYTKATE